MANELINERLVSKKAVVRSCWESETPNFGFQTVRLPP